jgi:hypothetical protein
LARGWGRSEEDQPGDKEQARVHSPSHASSPPPDEVARLKKRRTIELSLARIDEQLSKTPLAERRKALEAAREDLLRSLADL